MCLHYRTVRGDHTLYIHPSSVLHDQRSPSWVVFNEVIQTSKQFMRDVTVVSALAPAQLARLYMYMYITCTYIYPPPPPPPPHRMKKKKKNALCKTKHCVLNPNSFYFAEFLQIEPSWLYELAPHFYEYGTVSVILCTLFCIKD